VAGPIEVKPGVATTAATGWPPSLAARRAGCWWGRGPAPSGGWPESRTGARLVQQVL